MSVGPQYEELAARVLASSAPEPTPPMSEERATGVDTIRRAMRAKMRRRLLARGSSAVMAAAACVALYFAYSRSGRQHAILARAPVTVTGETLTGEVIAVHEGRETFLSPAL